ncbi:DUF421 domain-containing protein [Propioniciclava soli]|uniref:DUF421 domain-containing protein n=1 Tax=Propioniciclava soli TaxID=2775081 RepID=A0ABZ3CA20_9ACTN
MFFDGWGDLLRVLVAATVAYVTLLLLLRISGKRTLGQLNAFDFVVTVALGSMLSAIILPNEVSLAGGALGLGLLILFQALIATLTSRRPGVRSAVTASPALLLEDGRVLKDALRAHRMAESELRQAVRQSGHGDVHQIAAVVLETDGTLSVIPHSQLGDASALADLSGHGAPDANTAAGPDAPGQA